MKTPLWFTRCFTSADFIDMRLLCLPTVYTKRLRLVRTPEGARFRYRMGTVLNLLGLWGKTHHGSLSPDETASLFDDLVGHGALSATDSCLPATDGYHLTVHLRHRGTTNRFVFGNTSIFFPPQKLEKLLGETLARFDPVANTPQHSA